jgi:hypothetical protein
MRFLSKSGVRITVLNEYLTRVVLIDKSTASLYWVKRGEDYQALCVIRKKGKVKGINFGPLWSRAKQDFHALLLKRAVRVESKPVHALTLRFEELRKGHRCLAICHSGRKYVEVKHKTKIGAVAIAFREMNRVCGCRHRKKYEEMADYYLSVNPKRDMSDYAQHTVGRL